MDELDPKILDQLVVLLRPYLQGGEQERRSLLVRSVGRLPFLENLPWDASRDTFITYLVESLVDYGSMKSGEKALFVFLNFIKEDRGSPDFKKRIDKVLAKITGSKSPVSGTLHQDLHALTVRVRNFESDETVGLGILIQEQHFITCGQVIRAASNEKLGMGMKVKVYLSKDAGQQERLRYAEVVAYVSHYNDTIVILKLLGSLLPGKLHAKLSHAGGSLKNPFTAYGHVDNSSLTYSYVEGKILGRADYRDLEDFDCILLKLDNEDIEAEKYKGMKGAGVLDMEIDRVVGFWLDSVEGKSEAQAVEASIVYLEPLVSSLGIGESLDD